MIIKIIMTKYIKNCLIQQEMAAVKELVSAV